ncbi:catechol 2,3-dioxygenase-like lactoylglutathione lyase family enzyme [Mycobacterium frederiksbergense]|uniref:Catechol 2,3-dioxygenase-like lactoylglutathione lyase family enzyme n=1 Tax=Mycolicibacterium frederiksbergense TaxID=117567 RepID=A0ABT6L6M9_9MYCO|nr:VOC family protein [Mycolicibacterium frederiksbergense]MDH6198598.1 catechol 2,3-dioxygenase-like lactoylglutathione lyase family enzyme [Mycolicibacterium frederiksbergense]
MPAVGRAVIRVGDLDAAIDFYCGALEFHVLFDQELFPGFRSVHVGPGAVGDAGVWLFPAPQQPSTSYDEPALVLYSDDIVSDADRLSRGGADIVHLLSGAPGERSLHFRDPWGTVIVLAEQPE